MEQTQNPRHNGELLGTKEVLGEDSIEYEDAEDVDFAARAGMTEDEFAEAFGDN